MEPKNTQQSNMFSLLIFKEITVKRIIAVVLRPLFFRPTLDFRLTYGSIEFFSLYKTAIVDHNK